MHKTKKTLCIDASSIVPNIENSEGLHFQEKSQTNDSDTNLWSFQEIEILSKQGNDNKSQC